MNKLAAQLLQDLPNQVIEALVAVGCDLSQIADIVRLSQGLSNQNFLLTIAGGETNKQYVLRINSDESDQICHRQAEIANWQLANHAGLAPALVYASSDQRYFLSEFVATKRDWSKLANSAVIEQYQGEIWPEAEIKLLQLLQQLCGLPKPDNHISSRQQWQIYLDDLQKCSVKLNQHDVFCQQWLQCYQQLLNCAEQVQHILARLDACMIAKQYCHRDLNPHNILFKNDKLYCIDFEYACASHPLTDLATVLATHRLSTKQQRWLITGYLTEHPNLTKDGITVLPAAIDLYWIFCCCWSLLMACYHYATEPDNAVSYLTYYDDSYRSINKRDGI